MPNAALLHLLDTLLLDEDLNLRASHMSPTVHPSLSLAAHISDAEKRRHRSLSQAGCGAEAEAMYEIAPLHGYRYLSVRYRYTLGGAVARASLYTSRSEYLAARREEDHARLLTAKPPEAAALCTRLLLMRDGRVPRETVEAHAFFTAFITHMTKAPCLSAIRAEYRADGTLGFCLLHTACERLFLLCGLLLARLGALAADHTVRLCMTGDREAPQLCLSVHIVCPCSLDTADLRYLDTLLPESKADCVLAEHLAEQCGITPYVRADAGTLSVFLRMSDMPSTDALKSPAALHADAASASDTLARLIG